MGQAQGLIGVVVLLGIGYVLSAHRDKIPWRAILVGIALEFVIALSVLKFGGVLLVFDWIASAVAKVIGFADAGVEFVFGKLGDPSQVWGFVFVVKVLPVIIFFASLMGVLYHLGVMQRVVYAIAWVFRRSLGITGAEALSASANIFLGQTEAPLTVRPYIAGMTRSQLMCVMVVGFSTIAGSVMAAYIGMLGDAYATALGSAEAGRQLFAKHLLTASVMCAPAGIVFAKLMLPETQTPPAEDESLLRQDVRTTVNIVDAAAEGASEGLRLALNVGAMLVAFVALLALCNWPLQALGNLPQIAAWRAQHGVPDLSLQLVLGWLLTPIAWCMGIAWEDATKAGGLLGTQVIATEFVAYLNLARHIADGTLSPRSAQIVAYALCGFANVASIGIQIGGLAAIAPERRSDLARIAPRAMVAGLLACWTTGAIASVFM